MSPEIARLPVPAARRRIAITAYLALAMFIGAQLLIAPALPPGLVAALILGVGLSLVCAAAHASSFPKDIILRGDGLYDSSDRLIAPLSEIAVLDQKILSLNLTRGVVIKTHTSVGAHWSPANWARFGRWVYLDARDQREAARVFSAQILEARAALSAQSPLD
ncbi:MAG: hypothetical protein AAF679_04495 [Pseudomonadota bacterium]